MTWVDTDSVENLADQLARHGASKQLTILYRNKDTVATDIVDRVKGFDLILPAALAASARLFCS